MHIDMEELLGKIASRRKIFHSEKDFQMEIAYEIRVKYPEYRIRLEYVPPYNHKVHK